MDQSTLALRLAAAQELGRYEIYSNIHRALRLAMQQTLAQLGAMDPADRDDVAAAVAAADDLLELLAKHLDHENRFIHTALAARLPGSEARTASDHAGHVDAIMALSAEVAALSRPDGTTTPAAALALYQHFALFVAENFEHMQYEETCNQDALWQVYRDDELAAIEQAIVASIPPATMARYLRWMLPAMPHAERVGMLQGMRAGAPHEAFVGATLLAREHLSLRDWGKLASALGLAVGGAAEPAEATAEPTVQAVIARPAVAECV